jgi:hypothetical protein
MALGKPNIFMKMIETFISHPVQKSTQNEPKTLKEDLKFCNK